MKVVQAHKYYWHRDGAANHVFYISKLLEKESIEVIPFATKNPQNLKTKYNKFFVSGMDLSNPKKVSLANKIKYASRMFYSFEAKQKIGALLDQEKPDLVHLHNIYHHISPSILDEIKKRKIPIVMTLHDYKLLSPNYAMFYRGVVHEEDAYGWYLSCIPNRCMKNSLSQSVLAAAQMIFHHKIMKYYERYVDKFISPSEFIMNKFVEFGWPRQKFINLPNPIDIKKYKLSKKDAGYVGFFGRISEEKGLEILLRSAKKIENIPFKIVGEGPLLSKLKSKTKEQKIKNVEFLGYKSGDELKKLYSEARIITAPSISYENYSLSILEAKASGKIVIASNIGGIPEQLPKNMLVEPGNSDDLATRISEFFNKKPAERSVLGARLRYEVEKTNDGKKYAKDLTKIYKDLL